MNADPKRLSDAERPYVTLAVKDGVATLTMNRGERFNALSTAMIAALGESFESLGKDPSIRAVILAGEGKGFCAGHDLKEMRAHAGDDAWQSKLFGDCSRVFVAMTRMPQPIIARVHGIATAAGAQLVSTCDLAVASENATFALPGVNVGIFCSTPAVGVARNVGRKRAMELLVTGQPVSAKTALDWGLVNRVVPLESLDDEIRKFTDIIVNRSPAVISIGKKTFYRQIDQPLEAAYATASEAMTCGMGLEDAAEGIDAFLAKRPANWKGK
jgi:enoyl-CoA hydratase/carnithine racemase